MQHCIFSQEQKHVDWVRGGQKKADLSEAGKSG
jgi:hypothetical protein